MLNDLRYALRTLSGNRLFAAMAILSLALGIGANTAIYSFMDGILVRSRKPRVSWQDSTKWPPINNTPGYGP